MIALNPALIKVADPSAFVFFLFAYNWGKPIPHRVLHDSLEKEADATILQVHQSV